MNQIQETIHKFIINNAKEEKKEDARILLTQILNKQLEGTVDNEYIKDIIKKMEEIIKPEYIIDVKSILMNLKYLVERGENKKNRSKAQKPTTATGS
jgi:hypothetical protein